jgi:catechol 2,3-dioxygenase-like lactoylglutathione lyase family enzyme
MLKIDRIDHVVLTVFDIERTLDFYQRVLGMEPVTFAGGRRGLAFGRQKFNLHQAGREFEPKALKPAPGTMDFCLVTETPLAEVMETLSSHGVVIIQGPVDKTGAMGPIRSVYFRDPDGNLVEVSNYAESAPA